MRATLAAFAAMAVFGLSAPAGAQTSLVHEWCVAVDEAGISCNYDTLQQCRDFASGNGGFCERNPTFTAVPLAPGADRVTRQKVSRQRASS
jgi:hypothetical protein